ncbi:MAG TPA: DUF6325 family protein [Jiangellaceae bacterium]|nr:DUF6325 family protein [Jiangellaceae bacterium]
MNLGPVEVVVLSFPGDRVDPGVVEAIKDVVDRGFVTILDLVFAARDQAGEVRVVEFEDAPDGFGFADVDVKREDLVSADDIETIIESLEPGHSVAVLAYELTWARTVASAIADAGGQVELHVRIPTETAEAARAAAGEPA